MTALFCRPKLRFGDYMAFSEDSESVEPKLILKRKQADSIDKVNRFSICIEFFNKN